MKNIKIQVSIKNLWLESWDWDIFIKKYIKKIKKTEYLINSMSNAKIKKENRCKFFFKKDQYQPRLTSHTLNLVMGWLKSRKKTNIRELYIYIYIY